MYTDFAKIVDLHLNGLKQQTIGHMTFQFVGNIQKKGRKI